MSSPTQLCTVPPNDSYLHPEPFDGSDEINEDDYDVKVNEDTYDVKINEDTYDVKVKIFDAQTVLTETDQQKHFQHLREAVPNAKENHSVYPSEPISEQHPRYGYSRYRPVESSVRGPGAFPNAKENQLLSQPEPTSEPHPGNGDPRYSPVEPSVRGSDYLSKRKRSLTDSAGGPVSPVEDLSVKKEKNNPAKCGDSADRTRQSNRRQWASEDEMNPSYSPPSGEISPLPNARDAVHSGTMAESSDTSPRLYSQDDECPRQWSPSEDDKHRSPNDSLSRDISSSLNSQDDKSLRQWSPYIRLPQDSGHMKALHQDHQIRASSFPYDPNPVLWGQETTKLTSSSGVDSGLDSPYAQNEVMSPQTTPGILYPHTPSTLSKVPVQGVGLYADSVGEKMKNPVITKHSQTQDDPIKLNPAFTECCQAQTQEDPINHRKNDAGLRYREFALVVTTHDSPIKDPVNCTYPVPSRSHDSGLESTPMYTGKPKANQKEFQRTGDSPVTISIPDTNSQSQGNAKPAVFGTPCSVVNTSYFLAFTHPSIYAVASQVTGNRIHPGVQVLDHYVPFGAATRMPSKQNYAPATSGYKDALYPNLKPPQIGQGGSPYQSPAFGAMTRTSPYQSPEFGSVTKTSPYQSPESDAVTRTSPYQSPEFGSVTKTSPYQSPEFGAVTRTSPYQSPEFGSVTKTSPYQSPEFGAVTRTSPYQSPEFGAVTRTSPYQSPKFGSVTKTSPYQSPESGAVTRTSPYQSPEFGTVTKTSPYQSPESGVVTRTSPYQSPDFGAVTRTSYQSPEFGAVTRTSPYQSPEFGSVTKTSPYQSPEFGAVTRTSPYQSPEFGAVTRTSPYQSPEFGSMTKTSPYQSPESGAVTRTSPYQSPEFGTVTRTSPYQSPEFGTVTKTSPYQSPEFGAVTRTSPYQSPDFGAVTRTSYQSPEFGAVTRTSPYQSPDFGAVTRTSPYQSPEFGAMTRTSPYQSSLSIHMKASTCPSSSANYHPPTLKSSAIQGTEIGHPSPVQVNPERGCGLEKEQLSKDHVPDLYRQARTLHPNLLATRTPRMSYPIVSDVRPSARVVPKIPSNSKRPSTQTGLLSTQICTHSLHYATNVIPNTLDIQNPVGFLGRHGAAGTQVRHSYSALTSISEGRHALVKLLHGYQVHHQEDATAQTPQQDIEGGDFARNAPASSSEKVKVYGDGIRRDMEIPHVPPQIQQHTAFYPPYVPQAHYKPVAVKHDLVSKKPHSSSQNQNLQSVGSRTYPIVSDVRPSARVVPTTLPNPRTGGGYEEWSFPRHAAMFRKGTQVLSPTPTTHQSLYYKDGGTPPCNEGEMGQLKQDSPTTSMYPELSGKSSPHNEIFEDLGMEPKIREQRIHPIDFPVTNSDSFLQDLNNISRAQNSQFNPGKYNITKGTEASSQDTAPKQRPLDYPGTTTLSVQGHPGNKPPTLSERAQGYPAEITPSGYYLPGSTIRHPVSYSYPSRKTMPTKIEQPFMHPRNTLPANIEPPYMNPINTLPTSIEIPFLHTAPVPRGHPYPVTNSQYEHCGSSKSQGCALPSNQDQYGSKKVSLYAMSNSEQNKSRKQESHYDDLFQPLVQMATSSALGHSPARTLKPTSSAKRHRSSVDIKLHVPNQTNVVAEPHKGNEGQLGVSMESSHWCGDQNVPAHTPTTDLKEESKIKDEDHLPMPMESSHWCHDENVPAHMPTSDPKEKPTKKHGDQLAVPMESSHWCRDPNVPAHMSTSDPKEKKVEEVMHDKQDHEKIMKVEDVLQDQQDHGKIMTVEDMVHDQQDHRKIMKVEDVVHGQQDHGKIMILEDGIHDQQDYEMIKDTENEIQDQKDNADLLDSEDKKLSQHYKKKLLEAVDVIIDLKDQAKLPESEDVNSNQDDQEELLETEDVNSEKEDKGRQLEADDVLIDLKSQPKLLESEDVNSYEVDIEKLLEADNVILDLKDQTKLLEAEDVNTYQDDKEILLEFDDVFIEKDQTNVLESEDVNDDQDDKERLLEADDVILGLKDQTKFLESEEVNNDQDDKEKLEADNVFILKDQTKLLESEDERNQDDKENLLEADDVVIDLEDQTKLFETKYVNSDKEDKEKLLEDDDVIIDLKDQTKLLESEDVNSKDDDKGRQLDDVVDVLIDLKDQTKLLKSEDVNFDQYNKKKLLEADDVISDLKDQTKFFEALAITSDLASEMTTPGTSDGTDKPSKLGVDPIVWATDNQAQISESDEEEIVEEEMMKIKVGANFNSLVSARSDQVDFFWIFERLCLGVECDPVTAADQRKLTKANVMKEKLEKEEEVEAKLESVEDKAKLENEEEMEAKLEKEEDEAKLKMEEEMEAKLDREEEIITKLEMNEDTEPKFEREENKGAKLEMEAKLEPEEEMEAKLEMVAKLVMEKEMEAKIEIEEEMEAKLENEEEMEAKLETGHTHSSDNACILTFGVTVSCSANDSESVEYNYNQKQPGQSQGEILSSDTTSEVAVFSSANDSESVKYSNQKPQEQSQEEIIVETGSDTTSELVDHNNKQKQLVQSQNIVTVETGSDPTCELVDFSNNQVQLGQSQEEITFETCSDPTSELVDRSNESQEGIIVEICSYTTSEMVVLSSANDSESLDHSNELKPLGQSQEVVMVETGSDTELVDHIIEPKPLRQSLEETIVETDSDTTSELMHHSNIQNQPGQPLEETIVETDSDTTSELVDHINNQRPLGQSQEVVIIESGSDIPSPGSSVSDETLDAMESKNLVNDVNPDVSVSLHSIYLDNIETKENEEESRKLDDIENTIQEGGKFDVVERTIQPPLDAIEITSRMTEDPDVSLDSIYLDNVEAEEMEQDVVENKIQEGGTFDVVESKIQGPLDVMDSTNRVNDVNPDVSLSLDATFLDSVEAKETQKEGRKLDIKNNIQHGGKLGSVERNLDAMNSTNRENDVKPDVSVSLDSLCLDNVEAEETMQEGRKLDVVENRITEGERLVDGKRILRPLGRSKSLPRSRIPRGQYQLRKKYQYSIRYDTLY